MQDPGEDERESELHKLINLVVEKDPGIASIAEAAKTEVRLGADGKIIASAALRTAMRALVPGRDKAPTDTAYRNIGGWLSADNLAVAPVTEAMPYFTVSHWHWLAAKNLVRQMPTELGPTFPHLLTSEAQIMHDLRTWSALDERGHLTEEAKAMFDTVTGHAGLTIYGTVLLYAQRRAPVKIPTELKEFGIEAGVRDVPRVTFVIGVGKREVVCALVNNITVVFTRRLRRDNEHADAAAALLDLLDPEGQWPGYPLAANVVLPGSVVEQLSADPDTSKIIDSEPEPDADDKARAADDAVRLRARKSARKILQAAKIPAGAQTAIAELAGSTTHALATITVSTRDVDVSRGRPGSMALAFIRGRGIMASYPAGSGDVRRITYTSGNRTGINAGIGALSNAYRRG